MTLTSLEPSIACLADETVLIQAWKKASGYIRYHNWFSDTLELDRTAVNLREFIASISAEITSESPLFPDSIRMVPAPKSQAWKIDDRGLWGPVETNRKTSKIRPLAHVSLRDQVIATALMMCLADRLETRSGNPAIPLDDDNLHSVVSYGNRLYSDFHQGTATHRWGSATLYRGFYQDYRTFLARPEYIADKIHERHPRTLIAQSDLRQFFDRVTPDLLHAGINRLRSDADEPAFFELATRFLSWEWSDKDRKETELYAEQSDMQSFKRTVLPQGLVAAGFFANVALISFDEHLRGFIGTDVAPGLRLHDVARYVDDLRFVISSPAARTVGDTRIQVLNWLRDVLHVSAPGLSPAEDKTQVSTFRADERPIVQQSKRMARIQAAISGGFDPIAGGEILDSVVSLVRAQDRLAKAKMLNDHDPFRPVPDVRDATVDRFVAGRFRTTYRSLRPQLWLAGDDIRARDTDEEYSQFKGVRTRAELDDETRAFALELISKWVSDPSNVRLLRIALDLWPDPELLRRVLLLMKRHTEKGGPRNAPRRIAWYCLAEIFRAGAVETGFVEDDEQLPSGLDVEEYRSVLREEALRVVTEIGTRLPWYLLQQAYLFLATRPPDLHALPKRGTDLLLPYSRLLRFLKGNAEKLSSEEYATNAILARRSFLGSKEAVALVSQQITPARLSRIVSIDPNFGAEIVTAIGDSSILTPRHRSDLGLADQSDGRSKTLASIVLQPETRDKLRGELAILNFTSKFLAASRLLPDYTVVSPSDVMVTFNAEGDRIEEVQIQPRLLSGASIYSPPDWARPDEHWRFRLGFLLRFILTGHPDFTKPSRSTNWKETRKIYRVPSGHWYERIFGFFNSHSAFGDDWLPISDWIEKFLFSLLWWPGCTPIADIPVRGTIEEAREIVDLRLKSLTEIQGSSVLLLPLQIPRAYHDKDRPLRACVVQMAFPRGEDFPKNGEVLSGTVVRDDLTMSTGMLRSRGRRHLSAALAAVKSTLALRETHKGMDHRLDWLILPELAVHPEDVKTHLIPFARAHKTIILAGLSYEELFTGQPLVNSAVWVLPTQQASRGLHTLIRRQGKKHLAPNERAYEAAGLVQSFRPCQWLIGYDWSPHADNDPLWLTAAICFDATDLKLAADLKNRSDVFAIPALNQDVKTFDNMALALHFHMHQMVVVANNGNYGGSNAYAPYRKDFRRQVFHMHGQPQASIAFFELDDVAAFKNRKTEGIVFKPAPAG
ncbi:RNA-directed DNA polymerase [Rhizobium binae]|uniref:RNA-directed DNA polymerase n=1 Tax=Rhizobium binae TaxID=1138190 RepID=UPI001C82933B|nr:RNA-directed DNA polymerase [Rhizobium binae]MBX4948488.1 RNA-directed DNA polymerase [Rhizobium binae]